MRLIPSPIRRCPSRGGQSMVEFMLLGIPMMFVTMSVIYVSIGMWQFHSLAYSTEMTARYVSVHGASCGSPNSCTIRVEDVAQYFATQAMALDATKVVVKIIDGSGTTTCNPVNSCYSTATTFPSTAAIPSSTPATTYNAVGQDVTISATYVVKNPFAMFWPPDTDLSHDYTLGAQSRQRILF